MLNVTCHRGRAQYDFGEGKLNATARARLGNHDDVVTKVSEIS